MMRWDVLNHLIKKNDYKDYLEIGYYKGWSFDRIECSVKTAVDPHPCKDVGQESKDYGTIIGIPPVDSNQSVWKITSDEFFAKITPSSKWDIIFIDGLHEVGQVKRDFKNSLDHLNPGGTIVLHDCNPSSYDMTTTGTPHGEWTGDVYKTAIWLRHVFPYSFCVVDTDYGVGVFKELQDGLADHWISVFGGVANKHEYTIDWENFDKGRTQLLNLITKEEFLKRYG
jgi:hypothetical protein